MEHTILANGIRQGRTGGLILSQLHIGLAVGFAIVACLTAFGGGMIVGMWYKASEQSAPSSAAVTATPAEPLVQGQDTEGQPQEPLTPVTFYNTLTNNSVAYAPLTPPVPSTAGSAKGAIAPTPAAGITSGVKADVAGSAPARAATSSTTNSAKAATASKPTPSKAGTTRTVAVRESQKQTKATSVPKTAPAET